MKFTYLCLIASLLTPGVSAQDAPGIERLAFWSWGTSARLKSELKDIDAKLAKLPELAVSNTSLRVGLKTALNTGDDEHWLEVELPAESLADAVVLAPALAKSATVVAAVARALRDELV